ncbi:MAG: hypothetical protein PHF84_10465, partial [bacterium]|nr:hypothetical protein [bacterium]
MKQIGLSVILIILMVLPVYSQEDPIIRPGEIRIDFKPQIHVIANSPSSGWYVTNSGMDKVFRKKDGQDRKYKLSNGEYLFTDLWFMPVSSLKLNLGLELAADYANTFYQPVNMEHRIQNEYFETFTKEELDKGIDFEKVKERFRLWKAKAEFRNSFLQARAYTGYGHGSWEYEGDMFGFYPEQWDIDNYRRVSGRPAPTAFEADWNMNFGSMNLGKLGVAAGPEPLWGNGISYYARYSYKLRYWVPTVLFKYENIDWGHKDEYIWATALTTKYYGLSRIPLEAGILFEPFRVNQEYTVTHKTDPGKGLAGTDYYVGTKTTDYWDALGGKIKASTDKVPAINKTTLTYTYLGKIAGNMQKIDLELEKKIQPYYNLYWQNIYRNPVEEAEVLILEGENSLSPGQPVTQPRDRNDPFWVNSKNREAFISTFCFIYDPAPANWIFKYYPNIVELWNLNTFKKTPFSFIFHYKLAYYPGTTDLEPYKNSKDEVLWPGEYDSTIKDRLPYPTVAGAWPLTRPLHLVTIVGEFSVMNNGLVVCIIRAGEDLASSAIAYSRNTYELISVTRLFNPSVTFIKYPLQVSVEYGYNVWGPEQWYKDLGCAIDHVYKASVKYNLDKNNELELAYTGARE